MDKQSNSESNLTGISDTTPDPFDIAKSLSDYPSKVYYDDGELYVSSDEVRIRDKSWKLDDIGYVSAEPFYGWLKQLLIGCILVLIINYIANKTEFDIHLALYLVFFLVYSLCILALNTEGIAISDDLTSFFRLKVYTKAGHCSTITLRPYSKYRRVLNGFSKAVSVGLRDLHFLSKAAVSEDSASENPQHERETKKNDTRIQIYGFDWNVDDISKVEYRRRVLPIPLVSLFSIFYLMVATLFVPKKIIITAEYDYFLLLVYMLYLLMLHFLYQYPRELSIRFKDGTRHVISKYPYDDSNAALSLFAGRVKELKSQKKEVQNE